MNELRFSYGHKPVRTLLLILLMLGLAVFMGFIAIDNDRGLLINGFIELGTAAATVFYWVLAASVGVFALLALVSVIRHLGSEREVVLGRDAIVAPRNGFSRETRSIPYRSITGVDVRAVQRQLFLHVHHDGRKLVVPSALLPDKDAFARLAEELKARVAAVQPRRA